jgi:hypothetical protein
MAIVAVLVIIGLIAIGVARVLYIIGRAEQCHEHD